MHLKKLPVTISFVNETIYLERLIQFGQNVNEFF